MILRFIIISSFFVLSACNPELAYESNLMSSMQGQNSLSDPENSLISVVESEDSYIPKSVSVAEYSGSFKTISDNQEISDVMDKIIKNANSIVPSSSYALAYAVPLPFAQNNSGSTGVRLENVSIDALAGNPSVIIKSATPKDFVDTEISLDAIRDNKNQPDFFNFEMNNISEKEEIFSDFFSTSNTMN